MKILLGWMAFAAVIWFTSFILKRIFRFFFGTKTHDEHFYEGLADASEDVAAASRVTAALGVGAVYFLAPTGMLAFGAALGFVPVPFIVRMAPYLAAFAAVAAVISALAKLLAKSQRGK